MKNQLAFPFLAFVLSPELARRHPSIFEDDDGSYSAPSISAVRSSSPMNTPAQMAATVPNLRRLARAS